MFKNGVYTLDARLLSDGVDLGIVGRGHVVGFNYDTTIYTRAPFGTQYTDAAVEGVNLLYEIILLEASEDLLSLLFHGVGSGEFTGFHNPGSNDLRLGYRVGSNQTKKLQIVPTDSNEPHLYIPRGFVFDIGPIVWDRGSSEGEVDEGTHLNATRIVVAALFDEDEGCAFKYGNASDTEPGLIPTPSGSGSPWGGTDFDPEA